MNAEEAYQRLEAEIRAAIQAAERGDGRGMAELYQHGASTKAIAEIAGWGAARVTRQLRDEGLEVRPIGRPKKVYEEPKPVLLRPPIPERPTHCTCRNPCFGFPQWGACYCRKCGRPER